MAAVKITKKTRSGRYFSIDLKSLVETARKHGAGEKVENPSPLASYYYPRSIEFQGIDRLNYTKGIKR